MKHIPISSLAAGQSVESTYLIQGIDQRLKKNSEPYFFLTLQDSSGAITAMLWDNYEEFINGNIKADDFIHIKGSVRFFNDQLQLTVKEAKKVPESEVDIRNFQQVSLRDLKEMKCELNNYIEEIKNPKIKALIKNIFADKKLYNDFCDAPSSVSMHQAYIHGLLEHTLAVIKNCLTIAANYPKINRDILIAGGILHDLGKIFEYSWKRTFQITDVGRLLGHITIAYDLITRTMDKINDFEESLKIQILHTIISHHGILEYGSPKRPKTIEALLIHYADYIDAYLSSYLEYTDKAIQKGQNWTEYNKMFERYLFAGFISPDSAE